MRRSKSNPAKYARNYRKISQRHMSGYGDIGAKEQLDETKEKLRLESILHHSEGTWRRGLIENGHAREEEGGTNGKDASAANPSQDNNNADQFQDDDMLSLLSPELREQFSGIGVDNLLILPSKKKKKSEQAAATLPPLTPAEIKAAKSLCKNTQRKLSQLEQRRKQKEARAELYKQLEEHTLLQPTKNTGGEDDGENSKKGVANAINTREAQSLLLKSSERGKKVTKKQHLKQIRKKEAFGIKLTKEELDVLYVKFNAPSADSFPGMGKTKPGIDEADDGVDKQETKTTGGMEELSYNKGTENKKQRKKKKKKKKRAKDEGDSGDEGDDQNGEAQHTRKKARLEELAVAVSAHIFNPLSTPPRVKRDVQEDSNIAVAVGDASASAQEKAAAAEDTTEKNSAETSNEDSATPDYSQMMFAGLSSLKTKTDERNTQLANDEAQRQQREEEKAAELEEEERKRRKVYIPTEIGEISTMHHKLESDEDIDGDWNNSKKDIEKKCHNNIVQTINRPASIEQSRYDLPVSHMEYEIIDAVRSHDCTILCGETGSGKSTQVPQFLYEAGLSTNGWWRRLQQQSKSGNSSAGVEDEEDVNDHLLIGITQPRRVAAISTAKRVSNEMGFGNGQSITPNNLVAYQTRYETAGLGSGGGSSLNSKTRVKFMTDGILLQEIQSDLLLRKYGAIVIDEAHERNLNTDVLLGLLSVALPLRRKAAVESKGKLPPLKLVIMSATLRVEDFTENKRLFPEGNGNARPALVKVPGRTHPVSIHHSKVTELDDYEKAATEKTCKIHRRLPPGGILVFLTGKQEIVRCVNRLRQRLELERGNKGTKGKEESFEGKDVAQTPLDNGDAGVGYFRDMDDDEVDGDLFQKMNGEEEDDFDNIENNEDIEIDMGIAAKDGGEDDKRPKKVRILPLYSMLSAEEQAKVFAPVPEDTRLIVVATNIAETSITIPGISYVVDSGRQKCRNYHATTGVASYDVMWISKAASDQRAGRSGRTGPGHCYRLYSSSVYSRHLEEFTLPEVLTRPLEDVVLAMKAMAVSDVSSFPFPTPPGRGQVSAAVRLLANLGCVDVSRVEEQGGDGRITPLGSAVAKLPLGVRYGKMLLVAAQAGVLDYAIAMVAALSESSPFDLNHTEDEDKKPLDSSQGEVEGLDEVDWAQIQQKEKKRKHDAKMKSRWHHDGGDVLAAVKAVGAYAYACGAGGSSEKLACGRFCEENGLNLVVMQRIAKMRLHLCKLAKTRLPHAAAGNSVAATTGRYLPTMPPPKRPQECLLRQAIASGLLDNIARRTPPGAVLPTEFTSVSRSAYVCANSRLKEPLFIDNQSAVHSARPEWVCFDFIVRKTRKDGNTVVTMQRVTPVNPEWLASVCVGSDLMALGSTPLAAPVPRYIKEEDSIQCAVETKFGGHGWEIPPCYVDMHKVVRKESLSGGSKWSAMSASVGMRDDSFRWFARYLIEGRVLSELSGLTSMLNDEPSVITRCNQPMTKKAMLFVSALSDAGVDSAVSLKKHWSEVDEKFLFRELKPWVKKDRKEDAKRLWVKAVASNVEA